MNQMIEAMYEDDVLKPLIPIKGLKENEKVRIILLPCDGKKDLDDLIGTLTPEEAEEMMAETDREFSDQTARRSQELVRKYIPSGLNLSENLISERRRESERE
ncbi:MAG: antitoxin family protein [Desulfobacterales bacterium]|nr:antitoxin family protein [Desulfobacterales bacterium]